MTPDSARLDARPVVGCGSAAASLDAADLRAIVAEALASIEPGARVLAVIADRTRDDNTDVLLPLIAEELARRGAARFDALVAQGTHQAMTAEEKRQKIGADRAPLAGLRDVFDHAWNRDAELAGIGRLEPSQVHRLSGGLMDAAVPVRVNARLAGGTYDAALIVGATVPHEVAGFAGGAKYFFPGVAGPELTHVTHWLGALATIEEVIGRVETPTRRLIEAAADLIPLPAIGFTSVVSRADGRLRTHALFAGDVALSMRRAAAISQQVHVRYTGRRYRRVVALLDRHYDELWVGGKASYKLGGIIESGGELIVYAPHMTRISATHGHLIEKYGYAPLEQVREMVEGSDELRANLCVAAHLAHVSFAGRRDSDGRIAPRYRISLASAIDEPTCRRVKLGYLDYREFDPQTYVDDPDTLIVEDAGRDLYLPAAQH
ncbi:MAG TPA: lactate racemase domain-containing protein [Vicinamibacterales bacterium]|nr:lactate racemase domain-containing protein [Vicinamibacterales bacterium]